jgi:hypothetical protein
MIKIMCHSAIALQTICDKKIRVREKKFYCLHPRLRKREKKPDNSFKKKNVKNYPALYSPNNLKGFTAYTGLQPFTASK